jgi:tRNA-dihydrouridine synthase C
VSVKIRLGWDRHDEVIPIAEAAERGGASWLTIHGRTRVEMYGPPADHRAIGRARAAVGVPTIANGDLNTEGAIAASRTESGCSDFMLGRGPMGRPSLLCGGGEQSAEAERQLLGDVLLEYVDRLASTGSSEDGQVARVKQWLALGARVNPELASMFSRVKHIRRVAELCTFLQGGQS